MDIAGITLRDVAIKNGPKKDAIDRAGCKFAAEYG